MNQMVEDCLTLSKPLKTKVIKAIMTMMIEAIMMMMNTMMM